MSKRIECPVCGFEFTMQPDSSGMCECPSCESVLLISSNTNVGHDFVSEFEECVAEAFNVAKEAEGLDDSSLEDEIAQEISMNDYMEGTFAIFTEMDAVGYMAWDTRRKAEGVYILMHTNMYFGFEQ